MNKPESHQVSLSPSGDPWLLTPGLFMEQTHAIPLLERLHLAGEGWLSDIEHGRRAGIAARRGDRVERPEMCVSYRHNLYLT